MTDALTELGTRLFERGFEEQKLNFKGNLQKQGISDPFPENIPKTFSDKGEVTIYRRGEGTKIVYVHLINSPKGPLVGCHEYAKGVLSEWGPVAVSLNEYGADATEDPVAKRILRNLSLLCLSPAEKQADSSLYLPFETLGYAVDAGLHKDDVFTDYTNAMLNGSFVLSSRDIFRLAKALKPAEPTKKFIDYAKKTGLAEEDVINSYKKLRDIFFGEEKEAAGKKNKSMSFIRPKEIVRCYATPDTKHKSLELYQDPISTAIIRDYRIVGDASDFAIDTRGIPDAVISVALFENGKITEEASEILGAPINTFGNMNDDISYPQNLEGFRSLGLGFRGDEYALSAILPPSAVGPNTGSLWGKYK